MNWAPCSLAWWAYCSCFWIIDSLSPVQVACSSAPRTIRGIRGLLECSLGSNGAKDTRGGPPGGNGADRSVLLDEQLGELAAAPVAVERQQERVVEDAPPRAVVVAAHADGHRAVAVDRPCRVLGGVRVGLVAVRQPVGDESPATRDRLVPGVVAVLHLLAEQVPDCVGLVRAPGLHIAGQPAVDVVAGHRWASGGERTLGSM